MKVSFPLSLKVAVWLLLNLALLAAAAVAFLVARGGVGWDSLLAGSSGDRLHTLANVIVGEVSVAQPADRDAVLARFGDAYHAEFMLVRNRGTRIAGAELAIPAAVRQRIDEGPAVPPPEGAPDLVPDDDGAPPLRGRPGPGARPTDDGRPHMNPHGRFMLAAGEPRAWWIGLRLPFDDGGPRPLPATLLVRAQSFWSVLRLLNLETWLLGGATVLVLSILFWLPLVRSITHALRTLTIATERIADGRFDTRVATHRRDELGRLGHSVNVMASRLDTLVNGQKRFLADIAHELGSPVARLQVATEILESRAPSELRDQVADVREEVQQMAELVNELLAFTRAGLRPRDIAVQAVPLDAVVDKVIAREDTIGRVQRAGAKNLQVRADEPLLARALGNLVRNAVRYAPDSKAITVTTERSNGAIAIMVDDEGPGVPGAGLARLGEPFYRPEQARTRETGGVGLGLAIVRTSIAACGGEVRFANRSPRGFRAEIRLPVA